MKVAHQYAIRDPMELDRDGNYYCRHVSAMTAEGLHKKSDIAAELAWRDREIDRLRALSARASAGEGGESWACVELSVIPNAAAETGARMIALARQMGWNDESTANLIYTEMLLQASRYYANDTAASPATGEDDESDVDAGPGNAYRSAE